MFCVFGSWMHTSRKGYETLALVDSSLRGPTLSLWRIVSLSGPSKILRSFLIGLDHGTPRILANKQYERTPSSKRATALPEKRQRCGKHPAILKRLPQAKLHRASPESPYRSFQCAWLQSHLRSRASSSDA